MSEASHLAVVMNGELLPTGMWIYVIDPLAGLHHIEWIGSTTHHLSHPMQKIGAARGRFETTKEHLFRLAISQIRKWKAYVRSMQ